jgi:hypothetical protein
MDKQHNYQPVGPATFDAVGWNAHQSAYRKDPFMQFVRGIGWIVFVVAVAVGCGTLTYLFFNALPKFGM